MKNLFLFVIDGGDGSYNIYGTFDKTLVDHMEGLYSSDKLGEQFIDGDGFDYEIWQVPNECTKESIGFNEITWDWFD